MFLKNLVFQSYLCGRLSLELAFLSCLVLGKQFFLKESNLASSSSPYIDSSKISSDLALRRSTSNRLDYLYEISHIPKDSKIPTTDFPIVNPYAVFNKPQSSLKKTIKNILALLNPLL